MRNRDKIPERLKAYRIEHGLTQERLGALLNLPQSAISRMENGQYQWSDMSVSLIKKTIPSIVEDVA